MKWMETDFYFSLSLSLRVSAVKSSRKKPPRFHFGHGVRAVAVEHGARADLAGAVVLRFFNYVGFQNAPAEIALIERFAQNNFVSRLQFGQGEFGRLEFEANGGILEFVTQAFQGVVQDGFVIECQLRQVGHWIPAGV